MRAVASLTAGPVVSSQHGMTQPDQKARELAVFRGFARASLRLARRKSIRQEEPPQPDIICKPLFRRTVGYELVEVLDQDMARRLGSALDAKKELLDTYLTLPEAEQGRLRGRSLLVTFHDDASTRKRLDAVPDLLAVVGSSAPDHAGKLGVPSSLKAVVKYIDLQPNDLPHPIMDVSSFSRHGDPVLERIAGKFDNKTYEFDGPLELVVYYDLQDSLPIELQRERVTLFVKAQLPASAFRRVWVYSHRERRILLAFPAWGCLGLGPLNRRL